MTQDELNQLDELSRADERNAILAMLKMGLLTSLQMGDGHSYDLTPGEIQAMNGGMQACIEMIEANTHAPCVVEIRNERLRRLEKERMNNEL